MKKSNFALVLLAAITSAGPAMAQTLRPGLWEITNKMGGNPQMDQSMAEMQKMLASMSPAERKQMQDMMAKQGINMGVGSGGAVSVKVCMTKEMVERNDMPGNQGDCKTTQQQRSGNVMKMAYTCTNPPSSGEGQFTVVSDQAYTTKMAITSTNQGKVEKMTMDGSGKWLAADCGAIKPMAVPPAAKK